MPKKQPPKIQADDLPDSPSDRLYFDAERTVLDRRVKEFVANRDFKAVEIAFGVYGEFLERYPQAKD